jgi:hypothetical protein
VRARLSLGRLHDGTNFRKATNGPITDYKAALLPTDAQERKGIPIVTGVLDYFPDAIAAVAGCSKTGNDQHNPGEPLHWDKSKSTDHADCIGRHLVERGTLDEDGIRHSAKVAWRALALLQTEIENERAMEASVGGVRLRQIPCLTCSTPSRAPHRLECLACQRVENA